MSATTSSRPSRASLSPFRSRKSSAPTQPSTKPPLRPVTSSSSTSSRASHKPSVSPTISSVTPSLSANDRPDISSKSKENVTVTVRFRPLSGRELNKGDEVAWYADGDYTVRNEYNSSIAYGFDRVFGPATTTRHVYDVAAQHVVSGAMEGINGTVFAYGVTSSGKTHTMHGEQKSPGIVPLAVKDVFSIIQDTPDREFLLRISYLEIYNEVINDLLDPTGQNLRIREDPQGTYVEGIKEEVVLSPAHALSLIASGEAHRHVGSNNVNLLSSRSHTIFTLTIESSPRGEDHKEEDVTLSQMHLIDLAGSESSKAETTGLRRKEGSYINKSLLTLGTVISKLTDGKATHIPYRDSKLTRLLQSSLGGHGRISLICTVTPASSNSEETHNTLKFAHRSKHVEIKASQNKIMDEKSLIKKYQREISTLKEELQQLKCRMMGNPDIAVASEEDLVNLKLQLEAGQIKLQSRLEEEEQAKAALMGRIQRLTKLILVSTKHSIPSSMPEKLGHWRRHSFGEDELVYLPDKKRDYMIEDDAGSYASELSVEGNDDVTNLEELVKDYKRSKKRGMLGWFRMRKPDGQAGLSVNGDGESSASGSPGSCSKSTLNRFTVNDAKDGQRRSVSKRNDGSVVDSFPGTTQAGDLFSANKGGHCLTRTGSTIVDQMDLLREQVKILAEEVALSSSSLKRLSERAANDPENYELREKMRKIKDEISQKKHQMHILEQRMIGSFESNSHASNNDEILQALSKLTTELNQKTFDLEIKSADNRILQEQLQLKISENTEMEETILLLRQQLNSCDKRTTFLPKLNDGMTSKLNDEGSCPEVDKHSITSIPRVDKILSREDLKHDISDSHSQMDQQPFQMAEIENLNQEKVRLIQEKDGLEIQCRKLAEEASYAKELAAAAAVELRNLAEEVTRLSYENAKISSGLAAANEACSRLYNCRSGSYEHSQKLDDGIDRLQNELSSRFRTEAALEATIAERDKVETELRIRLNEARHREEELENELDDMWALVSQMKRSGTNVEKPAIHVSSDRWTGNRNRFPPSNSRSYNLNSGNNGDTGRMITKEELNVGYEKEQRKYREIQSLISTMQGEDIADLHAMNLGRATKPSY